MIKKILKRIALYLGIFLLFGIVLFPNLRSTIGNLVGMLLNPLLLLFPPEKESYIIIFLLATITGIYASLIQKYTMDWKLMRKIQEKTNILRNEFREAQLANNSQKMKKLQAQQAEMMGDQLEMMKQQFKPMLYISIISIPLFYWVYLVISQHPDASMVFPFWGKQTLNATLFGPFQYWLFWYFLCSVPVSQITRKALNIGGM